MVPAAWELSKIEEQCQGQDRCFKEEIIETQAATPQTILGSSPGKDGFCNALTTHDKTATWQNLFWWNYRNNAHNPKKLSWVWVLIKMVSVAWLNDGCSNHFWNDGKLPSDYTAQHTRRQSYYYCPHLSGTVFHTMSQCKSEMLLNDTAYCAIRLTYFIQIRTSSRNKQTSILPTFRPIIDLCFLLSTSFYLPWRHKNVPLTSKSPHHYDTVWTHRILVFCQGKFVETTTDIVRPHDILLHIDNSKLL